MGAGAAPLAADDAPDARPSRARGAGSSNRSELKRAIIGTLVTAVVAGAIGTVTGAWRVSAAVTGLLGKVEESIRVGLEAQRQAERAQTRADGVAKELAEESRKADGRMAKIEGRVDAIAAAEAERYAAILRKLDDQTAELRALRAEVGRPK